MKDPETKNPKESYTPMMQQYLKTKEQYPDCILFYRLGDFYEMFFEDAKTASKELELTLTGKSCGTPERAPMCGVPYHAADSYLARLVKRGYKVAICEQVEDPKEAKGLVQREVIRIVTPGTNTDPAHMDETKNHYILAAYLSDAKCALAACDVSTGAFYATELSGSRYLFEEIQKYEPKEILCNTDLPEAVLRDSAITVSGEEAFSYEHAVTVLKDHFRVESIAGLGLSDFPRAACAAGMLLTYLSDTQMNQLSQIAKLRLYQAGDSLTLDLSTIRNLELLETLRDKDRRGSLLWVLDQTKTAMGARLLRKIIKEPLRDRKAMEKRLLAVEALKEEAITREELREYLGSVYDLERLLTRITSKTANARDLLSFRSSLSNLPAIKTLIEDLPGELMEELSGALDPLADVRELIEAAIAEDPPVTLREGGLIRPGYDPSADELRNAQTDGKQWLKELEEKERELTGIKTLRIRFNKVFGYYIEVTNSLLSKVPDRYIRKQTLTTGERFLTPELKAMEDKILGAEEKLVALEYQLFCDVRDRIAGEVNRIQSTASVISRLDVAASLARVAEKNHYVKPVLNSDGVIRIKEGRHPVVEKMMGAEGFIPNDCFLDQGKHQISIITGPNMAGKSTYMRQVALIVLMAQMGSFVPAQSAEIGICDRIFTRVGASDDLASGQSTFMVEMTEVANILRNATRDSLLILDEIGRGTSTYDGMSIAWAVVEHISDKALLGARTLFATHYHELTELEGKLYGVNNYRIAVKEKGDSIMFLRKIVPGGTDKSYGIQVAKLSGVPDSVTERAKEIASRLNETEKNLPAEPNEQLSFFEPLKDPIIDEIKNLDLTNMTPMEAFDTLRQIQERVR